MYCVCMIQNLHGRKLAHTNLRLLFQHAWKSGLGTRLEENHVLWHPVPKCFVTHWKVCIYSSSFLMCIIPWMNLRSVQGHPLIPISWQCKLFIAIWLWICCKSFIVEFLIAMCRWNHDWKSCNVAQRASFVVHIYQVFIHPLHVQLT